MSSQQEVTFVFKHSYVFPPDVGYQDNTQSKQTSISLILMNLFIIYDEFQKKR